MMHSCLESYLRCPWWQLHKYEQAKKEAKKGGCIDVEDSRKYYQVHLSALGADALKSRFDR